jgi:IS1 family transposase
MANVVPFDRQVTIVNMLAEGCSIRSVERITDTHRDTIMRLGVRVGQGCTRLLNRMMVNLPSKQIEVDEIWGYVGKKNKNVRDNDTSEVGDAWTFIALDGDTKVVPCFRVGKRDATTANAFISDLASRLTNRVQLSSDALKAYAEAVELGFGGDVDYGQIVKSFSTADPLPASTRYSPPQMVSVTRTVITGKPATGRISTSYIERQNLTCRMHCRRLTRLTNAFSKKLENFKAAMGLHFGYYNLVKRHATLRMTPAMAAGVVSRLWSVSDLVNEANASP